MIIGIACQWSGVAMITACMSLWSRMARKRSEEHTSELQSRLHLVCRLLLEKKKHDRVRLLRRPDRQPGYLQRAYAARALHRNSRRAVLRLQPFSPSACATV